MQTTFLVYRLLCANGGKLELKELHAQTSGLACAKELESALQNPDTCAITVGSNGSTVVVAKTRVRLCRAKECSGCNNLHLCKLFLFGDCPWSKGRRGCRFCHDLYSGQNVSVLREHHLLELDRSELCTLLLQNDTSLLPPVCFTYNKGQGEHGFCPDKDDCKRLHVCERYIRGKCDDSMECTRSHDFYEPHPMKALQDRRVPNQLMGSMLSIYQNILALWDVNNHTSTRQGKLRDKTEICLFHVKHYCKQGNRCSKVHFYLPYKWEVRETHGWRVLPDNEEIERAFSDPSKPYSEGSRPVHFDTMTRGQEEVRRLCTAPSVVHPSFILTTKWVWYWEDEYGHWTEFTTTDGSSQGASISSEDLEKRYQEDQRATIEFTAGRHTYELNMQDMIQSNKRIGTKRLVRRRPLFVSAAEVQSAKSSQRGSSSHCKALPHHWDRRAMPETGFKRVTLQSSSDEFKKILDLFNQTMSAYSVRSIDRVQNKALWEVFQWQRDTMMKNNSGKDNEKLLFHGTSCKHMDAICQQNFDWRICGIHGTAFGKGSYFARDASYSHKYTDQSGTRSLFVCRVLVGDYTQGTPGYLRPPSKDGGDTAFYDSCVNNMIDPSIFVVFEKHQVYPEYIIQYEDGVQSDDFDTPTFSMRSRTKSLSNLYRLGLLDKLSNTSTSSCSAQANRIEPGRPLTKSSQLFGSMSSVANLSAYSGTSHVFRIPPSQTKPQRPLVPTKPVMKVYSGYPGASKVPLTQVGLETDHQRASAPPEFVRKFHFDHPNGTF